ncbi:MAG: YggT family protein [Clostridia bacterium]|nr:YggT family protein [Clostridia bacterium]
MDIFLALIKSVVVIFLTAVEFAMLVRAVLSWFSFEDGKLSNFLCAITEPFIYPVRLLFEKMNWFQNSPFDFAFLITYMIISCITIFLS